MKHFIDLVTGMSKHSISCAAIVDSKGNEKGFIRIRYTDATDGWNHRGHLILNGEQREKIEFRGSRNCNPRSLCAAIESLGLVALDWHERKIENTGESLSDFRDIKYIKQGRKKYKLIWVQ